MRRLIGRLIRPAFAVLLMLIGAYGWFAGHLGIVTAPDVVTDGLVVLTGEAFRLNEAIRLLAEGKARRLLISGVNVDVTPETLQAQLKVPEALFNCCVDFGYRARNTLGNAAETAQWAAANKIHTLRVVTAAYHMPRSLSELRRAAPGIILYPSPVTASGRNDRTSWQSIEEFAKYLIVLLRNALGTVVPLDRLFGNR